MPGAVEPKRAIMITNQEKIGEICHAQQSDHTLLY